MRNKTKEMYWLFAILSFLLLAFNLEVVPGRPWDGHYALIWKWRNFTLIRISPINVHVLVDKSVVYRYLDVSSKTYVSAVRLDTHVVSKILNYRYILDWISEPPIVKSYSLKLSSEIEILNALSQSF